MTLELTEQQRQAINGQSGSEPVLVVDPASNVVYVLIARTQYDRLSSRLVGTPEPVAAPLKEPAIAPGILRSYSAYRRDLPELLTHKKWLRKWVCYRGDERIGIARTKSELMRECLKRGWDDDEFIISVICWQGLVEEEDLGPLDPTKMVEEEEDIFP